jgi:hypothetical protein
MSKLSQTLLDWVQTVNDRDTAVGDPHPTQKTIIDRMRLLMLMDMPLLIKLAHELENMTDNETMEKANNVISYQRGLMDAVNVVSGTDFRQE